MILLKFKFQLLNHSEQKPQSWAWPQGWPDLVPLIPSPTTPLLSHFVQPRSPFSSLKPWCRSHLRPRCLLSSWFRSLCSAHIHDSLPSFLQIYSMMFPTQGKLLVTWYKIASPLLWRETSTSAYLPCGKNWIWLGERGKKEKKKKKKIPRGKGYELTSQNIILFQQNPEFHDGFWAHWVWGAGGAPQWKCPVVSYFTRWNSSHHCGTKENWTGGLSGQDWTWRTWWRGVAMTVLRMMWIWKAAPYGWYCIITLPCVCIALQSLQFAFMRVTSRTFWASITQPYHRGGTTLPASPPEGERAGDSCQECGPQMCPSLLSHTFSLIHYFRIALNLEFLMMGLESPEPSKVVGNFGCDVSIHYISSLDGSFHRFCKILT